MREDYIIRHIQMVGQFIAQMLMARKAGREDQAIQIGMQTMEQLFGLRMDAISALSLDAQLEHLAKGLPAKEARDRQFAYALLLKEVGQSYLERSRPEVAVASCKAALHIALSLILQDETVDEDMVKFARELLAQIPPEAVDAPLHEALALVSGRLDREGLAPE